LKCTRSWRKCNYGQLSEDPPPAPPADVFCDDDGDEEQPEAAARRDNFSLEDTVNPLALGASDGSQMSEPARSRAMSDGGPTERPSSQKPPPRGLGYPSSEPVNILDHENVSTVERISPPERAMASGGRSDARKLLGLCNDFRKAYSDGGQGASRHLSDLNGKAEELQAVLEQLEDISQDSKLSINYALVESVLKDCKTFFEKHPAFLKAPGEGSTWEKYNSTVEYAVSAKKELEILCTILESNYCELKTYLKSVQMYSTGGRRYYKQQLNLIPYAGRVYYSEGSSIHSKRPSTRHMADRSAVPQQLVDPEIYLVILDNLRKKSANESKIKVLDSMILDVRNLQDLKKNLEENEEEARPLLSNRRIRRRLSSDLVTTKKRDVNLKGAGPRRRLEGEPNVDLDQELDFCLDSLVRTPTGKSSSLAEAKGRSSPVPSQFIPLQGGKPLPKHESTQNLPPPPTEGLGFGKERESVEDIEAHIEQISVTQRHQSRPVPLEVRYVSCLPNACSQQPDPLLPRTICMSTDCYEYFERALDDTHITRCPACRIKQLLSNQRQEEKQQGWVVLDMPSPLRNRSYLEIVSIGPEIGSIRMERKYEPEPITKRTMLWNLTHWFGQFQVMICHWRMGLQRILTERVVPGLSPNLTSTFRSFYHIYYLLTMSYHLTVRFLNFLKVAMSRGTNARGALKDIISDEEIVLIDTLDEQTEGERTWLDVWLSRIGNKLKQRRKLGGNIKRLEWTCVSHKLLRFLIPLQNTDTASQKCGHRSHDDFQEPSQGAILELANDMFEAGYITHAQISNQTNSPITSLTTRVQNIFIGARRRISGLRTPTLPTFNAKSSSIKSIPLQCLPSPKCRWLHMCLNKPPYATKLEPLHVCKDDGENDFTDATFFQALRQAYFGSKRWKERLLFKLKKIEFVEVLLSVSL
jgi:hypothetical protein